MTACPTDTLPLQHIRPQASHPPLVIFVDCECGYRDAAHTPHGAHEETAVRGRLKAVSSCGGLVGTWSPTWQRVPSRSNPSANSPSSTPAYLRPPAPPRPASVSRVSTLESERERVVGCARAVQGGSLKRDRGVLQGSVPRERGELDGQGGRGGWLLKSGGTRVEVRELNCAAHRLALSA